MLMDNNDYECFNRDFFEQITDPKEILSTLAPTVTPTANILNLDTSEQQQIPLDLPNYEQLHSSGHHNNSSNNNNNNMNNINNNITNQRCTDYIDELASDLESRYWESKHPEEWTSEDVWHWIFSWAGDRDVDIEDVQPLVYANMTGQQLCSMTRSDFISMNPKYGSHIHETLQQLINKFPYYSPPSHHYHHHQHQHLAGCMVPLNPTHEYNFFPNLPSFELLRNSCYDLDSNGHSSSGSESDRESTSSSVNFKQQATLGMEISDPNCSTLNGHNIIDQSINVKSLQSLNNSLPVPVKKAGRRGRPPKKDAKSRNRQGKRSGKLWEFIRDLLLVPATNPSLIRWERREDGIFKFVQSDKVAKLWGQRKQNPRMTYEKLSRAMRYYYKSQVLLPVFGRRLVYKFGPNATGWRPKENQVSLVN